MDFAALLVVVGLVLFAVRRFTGARVADHPACAACGYDRRGLPPDAPCPECGSVRAAAPGERIGTATQRRHLAAFAILSLANGLFLLLALGPRGSLVTNAFGSLVIGTGVASIIHMAWAPLTQRRPVLSVFMLAAGLGVLAAIGTAIAAATTPVGARAAVLGYPPAVVVLCVVGIVRTAARMVAEERASARAGEVAAISDDEA